jgi:lipopolysaccharide export system protein LptC
MTMTLDNNGFATLPPESPARATVRFRSARRHSRIVRMLRRVIPIGSLVAFIGLIVLPFINPFGPLSGLSVGPINLSGSRVTMEMPKLTGFRKDNRPYEVTATSASQDIRKPNLVDLTDMKARLEMESSGWVRLESKKGTFDSQKEQMQLNGDIKVITDTGYQAFLKSADIDFKAGTILSREPVRVSMGETTITADTLDVTDNGKVIVFAGRVSTLISHGEQATVGGGPARGPGVSLQPAGSSAELPPTRTVQ